MAAQFDLSASISSTSSSSKANLKAPVSHHARSSSLPGPSHPPVSHLEDEISALLSWQTKQATSTSASSLRFGLSQLELLHLSLNELLQLSSMQDSLYRHRSSSCDLLDNFLHLADVYGHFRDALIPIQEILSEAKGAIRRRDANKLSSQAREIRRHLKKISKLESSLLCKPLGKSEVETEIVGILSRVRAIVASSSASIFSGLVAIFTTSISLGGSSSWTSKLKKKLATSSGNTQQDWEIKLEGLKELNYSLLNLEIGCEKVYRCLINTRVSLLNSLTP